MTDIRIRRAQIEDHDCIVALYAQLGYIVSKAEMRDRIRALIQIPSEIIYVADKPDAPAIGCIHAGLCRTLSEGEYLRVYGLVVDAEYRGQHIGQLLMEAAEEWARGLGCKLVWIRSNIIREDAHRFYDRIGYEKIKTSYTLEKVL
jgi:GNAT superfamily N-acetyltransferase